MGGMLKNHQLSSLIRRECQHGLSLDRRGGQFDTPCEVQKEVQADILCGQEHNLDSDKTHVRSILYYTC